MTDSAEAISFGGINMTNSRAERKKKLVRIIALTVAGVMAVSVVLAAILAQG